MAVFDVSQSVIAQAGGLHSRLHRYFGGYACRTGNLAGGDGLGAALGLWLQSALIGFTMKAMGIIIFVLVYGRMLEIYLLTSLAPIPVATLSNRELGGAGQNYIKSLFAVGFQGAVDPCMCCNFTQCSFKASQQAAIPLGRFGELWATRFCFASCSLRPGALPSVSLALINRRRCLCREDTGRMERAYGMEKRRRSLLRQTFTALWRKRRAVLQRKELMDDPAQPAPASGKEEFYLSKNDDVLLTSEQIAAEERRWLFDAPIAELAEVKGVSIDEAVKMRTDAVLQEAVVPITVSVRPIEPQGKLIGFASVNFGGVGHRRF